MHIGCIYAEYDSLPNEAACLWWEGKPVACQGWLSNPCELFEQFGFVVLEKENGGNSGDNTKGE